MSKNEDQSTENEENPPVENDSIIELVEELFDELDEYETFEGLPKIDREDFGVPESEEGDEKFRIKTKDEIIQIIREIFNDSNSFEQQRKKYRLEVIKIVCVF